MTNLIVIAFFRLGRRLVPAAGLETLRRGFDSHSLHQSQLRSHSYVVAGRLI